MFFFFLLAQDDPSLTVLSLSQTNPKPSAPSSLPRAPHHAVLYPPCTVSISLAFLSLHQSHGSQGLPVSFCRDAALHCATRPPPPVATPPSSLHLHRDRLAILIHKVQLLPVSVMRRFVSLGLTRWNETDDGSDCTHTSRAAEVQVCAALRRILHNVLLLVCNIQVLSVVLMKDRGSRNTQWQSGSLASTTRSVSSLLSNFLACLTTIVLHNAADDSHSLYIKRSKIEPLCTSWDQERRICRFVFQLNSNRRCVDVSWCWNQILQSRRPPRHNPCAVF